MVKKTNTFHKHLHVYALANREKFEGLQSKVMKAFKSYLIRHDSLVYLTNTYYKNMQIKDPWIYRVLQGSSLKQYKELNEPNIPIYLSMNPAIQQTL